MSAAFRKITVRTVDGDVDCEAAPTPVPGLYVVSGALHGDSGYAVAHTSGIAAGSRYPDPEAALAAAIALGDILDWSMTALEISQAIEASPEVFDAYHAAIARWGGSTYAYTATDETLQAVSAR